MVYCYECGEQVAQNDVFCPYCGISLSPSSIGVEAKTLKDEVPAAATPQTTNSDAAVKNSPNTELKPLAETAYTQKNSSPEDFSNQVTADNINLAAESLAIPPGYQPTTEKHEETFAVPAPKIIEPLEPIAADAVSEAKNSEDKSEKPPVSKANSLDDIIAEPVFKSSEGEALPPAAEAKKASETQNESSLRSYDEAEVKKIPSPEKPEVSVAEFDEFGKFSVNNDIDLNDFDAKGDFLSEEDEMEQEFARAENLNKSPLATPKSGSAEHPIIMPSADLPVEEKFPPTRFDSVSIMEKDSPDEERSAVVSPTPQSNSAEISNVSNVPYVPITVETPSVQPEKTSFTQQNINEDTDGRNKKKLKPLDEGTVLNGRYEIVRKIGGGGMGAVYLASDKNLGGVLRAVKEMVQSYIEDEQQEKAVNDFKRESLLLTSLDHQSIPTIYDYFFDEKEARFYLVMKYISGGDLSSRLRSAPTGRIDEAEVAKWATQITDVLDYLHNRQPPIVYRDLKPANIMVDGNSGRTMLIDFGIARWVNKEEKGVTAVGTMGYAPPELFSGNVEARSDIYSLGSTMFHLLTGADPQSNPLLIFDFQKNPRPRQINPQLSDQMERILMRAVEYSADKRFASAAEMRQALEDHLENLKRGNVTYGVKEAPASVALSDQPVFCGFCGQKIVATDMFCAFCGAKQPLAQKGVHSEIYSPMPLTAQLLIIGTSELEQPSFRLEKEDNLVGRRDPQSNIFPEVDLSKYDPQTKISRRHARIWREGNEFMVEDLGSSNGTYILPVVSDTVRLQPRQPQLLTNGDKIRLGDTTLHFILG